MKYVLNATVKSNGGFELATGMYATSDAAGSLELVKKLSRPKSQGGPTAIVQLEEREGGNYARTILGFLDE